MKQILITGKHSYLGNQVKKYLEQFKPYKVDELDLHSNWEDHDFSKYDCVFHVAGIAHSTPKESEKDLYYQINTDLAFAVAKKAEQSGCRQFIFMSSIIVYGNSHRIIDGSTSLSPDNFYGDSKKRAEEKIWGLHSHTFHVCIVRSPMIYGPGSKGNYALLSKFAQKTPLFPNIKNQRSMLYVGNFTAFIKGLIDTKSQGFFLPQNKEWVETRKLVQFIAEAHGHSLHLTKAFDPMLAVFKENKYLSKLFGDLVIDPSLSKFEFDYQIYDFKSSIEQTEKGEVE